MVIVLNSEQEVKVQKGICALKLGQGTHALQGGVLRGMAITLPKLVCW